MIRVIDKTTGEVKEYENTDVNECIVKGVIMVKDWEIFAKSKYYIIEDQPELYIESDNLEVVAGLKRKAVIQDSSLVKEVKLIGITVQDNSKKALFQIESILMLRMHELSPPVKECLIETAKILGSTNFN
jgi:hypothetical protein